MLQVVYLPSGRKENYTALAIGGPCAIPCLRQVRATFEPCLSMGFGSAAVYLLCTLRLGRRTSRVGESAASMAERCKSALRAWVA